MNLDGDGDVNRTLSCGRMHGHNRRTRERRRMACTFTSPSPSKFPTPTPTTIPNSRRLNRRRRIVVDDTDGPRAERSPYVLADADDVAADLQRGLFPTLDHDFLC